MIKKNSEHSVDNSAVNARQLCQFFFFAPYCDKISVNGSASITGITVNGSMVAVVVAKAVAEVIDS